MKSFIQGGEGMNKRKLLEKVLAGPKNVHFNDMISLVNLQEKNGKAKPYQVRQFLQFVEQYDLELGD